MRFIDSSSERLNSLGASVNQSSKKLFQSIKMLCEEVTIDEVDDLYREHDEGYLYFVESGELDAATDDNAVYYFEPGDLIGLQELSGFPEPVIRSDGQAVLYRIDRNTFKEAASGLQQFKDYLLQLSAFFAEACCQGIDAPAQAKTSFKTFKEGEVIIREGDAAEEVFDLVSGAAAVFVQGQQVGTVGPSEIFGAMAALTKTPRTATVIAQRPCTVMSVPMDEFVALIRHQPRTGLALLENMAQQILALNKKLVDVMEVKS